MPFDMCKEMLGKVFDSVSASGSYRDELVFTATDGTKYIFYHMQDCCEEVCIEDIAGDLSDLEGSPLLMSEQISNNAPIDTGSRDDSVTWTYYKFSTIKGYVTIRWCGTSNGYYSESVDERVEQPA